MLAWTYTPEGIEYLREAFAKGKASGTAVPVDFEELRQRARRRVAAKKNPKPSENR